MATYKDWMLIENPNSLDEQQLKQAIQSMGNAANKRLKRMENRDIYFGSDIGSDTTSGVKRFGVKGKDLAGLKREFKRVRNFLNNPQSSITGMYETYKKFREEVVKGRKRRGGLPDDDKAEKSSDYRKMRKQKSTSALETDRRSNKWEELRQWRKLWDYYNKLVENKEYAPSQYDSTQVRNTIMSIVYDQSVQNLSDEETYERIVSEISQEYEVLKKNEEFANSDISTSSFFSMGESD